MDTHELCATIIPFNIKRKGFTDLTGAFPHKSIIGNLYAMVMYDYNSNIILVEPIKNRQTETIRNALLNTHKVTNEIVSDPKVYIMDNKCSSDLREAMTNYEIDFQLAPPHMNRKNAAERAIRTCKNHFISEFSTKDIYFPISEWDRLLSQCVITLNILINSRVNPALSAYALTFGPYVLINILWKPLEPA